MYAEETSVPISKSRVEIEKVLRQWGAAGVQWTDNWTAGTVTLRFGWLEKKTARQFTARFTLQLRTDEQLRKLAVHRQTGRVAEGKLAALRDGRGRQEHRVLVLWLKAAFNAVDLGIVSAEQLFMPWMEGGDGQTVAEMVLPRVDALLAPGALKLLPAPKPPEAT